MFKVVCNLFKMQRKVKKKNYEVQSLSAKFIGVCYFLLKKRAAPPKLYVKLLGDSIHFLYGKNKKPVINFIDKQMIKSMTGEEERIFSFPENISYFLEMIIQTQTEYFIRTAIYICTFYSGIIITFCSLCIIIIVSPEICNINTP